MKIDLTAFDRISDVHILVVGDVMLDRYLLGDTNRISPESPVPIIKLYREEERIGGAANVANNISQLGANVGILGVVGCDKNTETLCSLIVKAGIVNHLVTINGQTTITKTRILAKNQQVVRLDEEQNFSEFASLKVAEIFSEVVDGYDIILFSDYGKGSLRYIQEMIKIAKDKEKKVLIDPKNLDILNYKGADIISPNLMEFKSLGGSVTKENEILSSARLLMKQHQIGAILLTRSEEGMTFITPSEETYFDAQVIDVNDVTGAGDTVIAIMATFLGIGFDPKEACLIANTAASIVVTSLGAVPVSLNQLADKLTEIGHVLNVPSKTPTLIQIRRAQAADKKIVFTNGCFDILHPGHVRYLSQARALGDYLIVGLNTDASVKRLKGDSRPVFPWSDRAFLLSSLKSVDWILPFGDEPEEKDSPQLLIEQVNPDFLVKGGDYKLEDIIGSEHVLKNGGHVRILDFEDGQSTSLILSKILNQT